MSSTQSSNNLLQIHNQNIVPNTERHSSTTSITVRGVDKTNLLRKFKLDEGKLQNPKHLSNYNKISLQNQVKEQEEQEQKLQQKMSEFYYFLISSSFAKGTLAEKEKERYHKVPNTLLFDYLKSFFFKVHQENQDFKMKLQKYQSNDITAILSTTKELDTYFTDIKKKNEKLNEENIRLKQEIESTILQMKEANENKKQTKDKSQIILLELQKDNERLLQVINDKNFEIELLQKDVNNNELQLMKFKDKVVEQSKLQEKLKLIEQKYVQDINLAKNKINKDEDEKNKEGKKNVKLMSINQVKDEKIEYLETELKSFRERFSLERTSNSQSQKLVLRAELSEKIAKKAENEIKRLKIRIEEKDKYIEKQKQDYDKLFNELKQYKKDIDRISKQDFIGGNSGIGIIGGSGIINGQGSRTVPSSPNAYENLNFIENVPVERNPYLIDEYKKRVREQDVLITNMRKKFKKMNLAEKKGYIKQKEFEMQRYEYEKQLQDIKKQSDKQQQSKFYETESEIDEKQQFLQQQNKPLNGISQAFATQYSGYKTHRSLKSLPGKIELSMQNLEIIKTLRKQNGQPTNQDFIEKIRNQIVENVQPSGLKSAQSVSRFIKVNCPGKVIITGEHSVVYGKPALVMAINLRTKAKFQVIKVLSEQKPDYMFKINISSIGNKSLEFSINLNSQQEQLQSDTIKEEKLANFIIQDFIAKSKIPIESNDCYYQILIEIESDLPIGAGLGSSAAYSVSLASSIYLSILSILDPTSLPIIDNHLFKQTIQKYADFQEKLIHTNPSGVDVAISIYGGMLEFIRGTTQSENKMNFLKKSFNPKKIQMYLINTNRQRDSKRTIEAVMSLKQNHQDQFDELMSHIEQISKEIINFDLEKDDDQDHQHFLQLIQENQKLLNELGVSSKEIENVIDVISKYDVIGKLTGAGGGGCVIGFSKGDQIIDKDQLKQELESQGFSLFKDISQNESGLNFEVETR